MIRYIIMCFNKAKRIPRKNLLLRILGFGIVSIIILCVYMYTNCLTSALSRLLGATDEILRTHDVSYGKFILDMEDIEMEDLTSASDKNSLKRMFRVKTTITMETEVYSPNDTLPQIRMYDDAHTDSSLKVMGSYRIVEKHYLQFLNLLEEITKIYDKNNIEYIIGDGTLLGSYVMHDVLPWDDDVDLMVKYEDYMKIKTLYRTNDEFQELFDVFGYHDAEKYDDNEWISKNLHKNRIGAISSYEGKTRPSYHKHKVFFKTADRISGQTWRWPFVDIKFYKQNISHVWNFDFHNKSDIVHYSDMYPIHKRPLAGLWLPAPHRTGVFLREKFTPFKCRTGTWNHQYERPMSASEIAKVNCSTLIDGCYPYVKRIPYRNNTLEMIWDHDHVRYAALINAQCDKRGSYVI